MRQPLVWTLWLPICCFGYVRKLNVNLTEVSESVIIMNEYKFI